MMEPGHANFIPGDSLQLMISDFPEAAIKIARQLSRNYFSAYEEIRTLGLAASPSEKFAKLQLSWSTKPSATSSSVHIYLPTNTHFLVEFVLSCVNAAKCLNKAS
jgi:hypothetical protein